MVQGNSFNTPNNWIKLSITIIFLEKYEYIGRLLRPGELSRNYSDGETEGDSSEEETDVSARPKAE